MDLHRRQRRTIRSEYLLVLFLLYCFLPVKSISSRRHLVCTYRGDTDTLDKKYQIEDIPMDLCTHVLYEGSASYSPWEDQTDILKTEYQKFADIKNRHPHVKLFMNVICLPCHYEDRITLNDTRNMLIERVIRFLRKYNLDGISYAGWYQLELIEETKQAFNSAGNNTWTVSVDVSKNLDDAVQQQRICRAADFVILSVNRQTQYNGRTDIRNPLYRRRFDTGALQRYNIKDATQNLINSECPRENILLRVSFNGMKFVLGDASDHDVNAVAIRQYLQFMDYNEICSLLQETGWTVDWDERSGAPFAYRDKEWIGYENEVSLEEKANFVNDEGLGGLVVHSIYEDDYKGVCGTRYPLLMALWKAYKPTRSTDDDPFVFALFRTTERPLPASSLDYESEEDY